MIDNSKEYVLCAAVKRLDGGFDCGYRHSDIFDKAPREDVLKTYRIDFFSGWGFLTSKGRFVDRIEAWKIALQCGQVEPKDYDKIRSQGVKVKDGALDFLASEDLY